MNVVVDHTPARLWHWIVGEYVGVIKCTPMFVFHATNAGRLNTETLNVMTTVVETSRMINRIMNRNENFGA